MFQITKSAFWRFTEGKIIQYLVACRKSWYIYSEERAFHSVFFSGLCFFFTTVWHPRGHFSMFYLPKGRLRGPVLWSFSPRKKKKSKFGKLALLAAGVFYNLRRSLASYFPAGFNAKISWAENPAPASINLLLYLKKQFLRKIIKIKLKANRGQHMNRITTDCYLISLVSQAVGVWGPGGVAQEFWTG